jgi:hypothetical protein
MDDESGSMMVGFDQEAHSFVIRIWKEPAGTRSEWRGWINHVQSGQCHHFRDSSAISPIVADYLHNQHETIQEK